MPRQQRWRIKRKLDSAITHLETTIERCDNMAEIYKQGHPDLYIALKTVSNMAKAGIEIVESVKNRI